MRCTFQIYINPKILSILILRDFCRLSIVFSFSLKTGAQNVAALSVFRFELNFRLNFSLDIVENPERESLSLMGWDWMGCVIIIYKCWINPHVYRPTNIQSDICFVYVYFTHSHTLVRRPCAWHYNVCI